MKPRNKFHRLSPEDQQKIINLCHTDTYDQVLEILALPREEGGFALDTSISGLCRFYTSYNPEAIRCKLNTQFAQSIQINHQRDAKAVFEATLALVQNRILEALKAGRPLAEMEKEFRILKTAHKAFLQDDEWRRQKDVEPQDRYNSFLEQSTILPEADFIRNDVDHDPGAGDTTIDEFDTDTDDEIQALVLTTERERQRRQLKELRAVVAASLATTVPGNTVASSDDPSLVPSATGISTNSHQKTPDFSHFSPKIVSQNFSPPPSTQRGPSQGKPPLL